MGQMYRETCLLGKKAASGRTDVHPLALPFIKITSSTEVLACSIIRKHFVFFTYYASILEQKVTPEHPEAPFASLFGMRFLPNSHLPSGQEANPSLILFSVPSRMLRVTPTLERCGGGDECFDCECEKSSDAAPTSNRENHMAQNKPATLFPGPRKWMNKHVTKKNARFHLLSPNATTTCLKAPAIKMHAALHTPPHPRPR